MPVATMLPTYEMVVKEDPPPYEEVVAEGSGLTQTQVLPTVLDSNTDPEHSFIQQDGQSQTRQQYNIELSEGHNNEIRQNSDLHADHDINSNELTCSNENICTIVETDLVTSTSAELSQVPGLTEEGLTSVSPEN